MSKPEPDHVWIAGIDPTNVYHDFESCRNLRGANDVRCVSIEEINHDKRDRCKWCSGEANTNNQHINSALRADPSEVGL